MNECCRSSIGGPHLCTVPSSINSTYSNFFNPTQPNPTHLSLSLPAFSPVTPFFFSPICLSASSDFILLPSFHRYELFPNLFLRFPQFHALPSSQISQSKHE
ncbi:hypothetical protein VNO80_10646 [Phaseolus coccineus]|uniref:Uncharacterized protein n=1 Tax=Phaseolus coccineus TaxID=3886 RepID=A0AAN9NEY4_PHACN